MTTADDDRALRLEWLAEETARREAALARTDEAVAVATRLLSTLDEVAEWLDAARVWATWDVYGGGLLAAGLKYRRLRHARRAATLADPLLARLRDQVAELVTDLDVTGLLPQIDDGLMLDDLWPSGLRADAAVRESIVVSEAAIERLRHRVMTTRQAVQSRRRLISHELGSLAHERSRLRSDP